MMRRLRPCAALAAALPLPAFAHAFGERYDLPAPLGYFMAGAAATVLLTFAVAILAVRRLPAGGHGEAFLPLGRLARPLCVAGRTLGMALLLLAIAAGFWGDPHPAKNIAPTLVWIIGWVGLSLLAALVIDLWPAIDPWRALPAPQRGQPRYAPHAAIAVALFLGFAWLEVIDPLSSRPAHLASLLLAWTALAGVGVRIFGRETWVGRVDPLSLYFAALGRFAPLAIDADRGGLVVRPWGRALANAPAQVPVAFVLAMLSTVLFDGLLGTQAWRRIDTAFAGWAPGWNDRDGVVLGTVGLAATWIAFLGAYRVACALTAALAPGLASRRVAELFAATLVPIAVAYLVAHNLSYLLVQGQGLLALASDPFGRGWNLFGTAAFTPDIGLIGARATWYIAITAIVTGHVISVWLAHRVALAHWPTARRAALASVPLTTLMIGYTAVSLSVVAEPLTRYRTPDPSYSRGCENERSRPAPGDPCRDATA